MSGYDTEPTGMPERGADYRLTLAQEAMRKDVERGLGRNADDREPKSIGQVLDEVVGPETEKSDSDTLSVYGRFQRDVPNIAYEVINTESLTLSLADWTVVQRLVEKALVRGYNEHV